MITLLGTSSGRRKTRLNVQQYILIAIFGMTLVCIFFYWVYLNSNFLKMRLDHTKFNIDILPSVSDGIGSDQDRLIAVSRIPPTLYEDIPRGNVVLENYSSNWTGEIDGDLTDAVMTDETLETGCHFPLLNPFDSSIMEFMTEPEPIDCTEKYPFIFATDFNRVVIETEPEGFGWTDCCYRNIVRSNRSDHSVSLSINCYPLQNTTTEVHPDHEFIAIACKSMKEPIRTKILDILAFVPPKKLKSTKKDILKQDNWNDRLNVVILGLDGLSHMNFIRLMGKTHNYLKKNLSAYEMFGYTKVGDNTYPNIVPVLTSFSEDELVPECLENKGQKPERQFYDTCPFVWKSFSENGFLTSFAEDAPWIAIFNYEKKGFKNPPTDYYLRPMTYFQEKMIGNHRALNVDYCYGPRLSLKILLEYMQKMAATMKHVNSRYFQFVWATALFHDSITDGKHGDTFIYSTVKWFKENNYLNNTALIMMSDHGLRFGGIRYTYQGKIEERMPLLYIVLPKWFQMKYSTATMSLKTNQNKLTTPFDLHETLKDLLNPGENIGENAISKRINDAKTTDDIPRGISLFSFIPPTRTCEMAGIDNHWCVCQKVQSLDLSDKKIISLVKQAANTAVYFINKFLEPFHQCAFLALSSILNAQSIEDESSLLNSNHSKTNFGVTFTTEPGNGTFEATININQGGIWGLAGDVSRINLYGNQSHCVHSHKIKKYCYCLDIQLT